MIEKLITPLVFKIGGAVILILLAALGVQSVRLYAAHATVKSVMAENKTLTDSLSAQTANVTTANEQHGITKRSLERTLDELLVCQGDKRQIEADTALALKSASSKQSDTEKALAKIARDYQRAMRDPACLICGNRPVCPALLGGSS